MPESLHYPVIVQKFGGTTIRGPESFPDIERIIRRTIARGFKVIAVVSAMGRGPQKDRPGDPYATDTLLNLLSSCSENNCLREKDLLMMCGEIISAVTLSSYLRESGLSARARSGFEAGVLTDNSSGNARIRSIQPQRLLADLAIMDVVVVAGFQGISEQGTITTLGRGGSDTTAVALGHAVKAERIEIYTDQEGIFSADPKQVKEASHLDLINAKDIVHMSWAGAKVLDPRAAEMIDKFKLNVLLGHVRHPEKATMIEVTPGYESSQLITAIAHGKDVAQLIVKRTGDAYCDLQEIFSTVTNASISMDMFSVSEMDVRFTVAITDCKSATEQLRRKGFDVNIRKPCQKVSIVGAGMHGIPGVMSRFTKALTSASITILQTVDSHATISALVSSDKAIPAQVCLHREFINR